MTGQGLNEKQTRWVHNIQSSGEQLLNLINDILDLAKIEAGKMQVRIEDFSIHDVFEVMLTMFKQRAEKKNIDLREHIIGNIPLLRQDPGKIQQILANLLSNAITFTPEGGRVLLTAEATPNQLILVVSDTGVGIAPEDQGSRNSARPEIHRRGHAVRAWALNHSGTRSFWAAMSHCASWGGQHVHPLPINLGRESLEINWSTRVSTSPRANRGQKRP